MKVVLTTREECALSYATCLQAVSILKLLSEHFRLWEYNCKAHLSVRQITPGNGMKGTTSLCSCRKLFSLIVMCDFFMMRLIKKKNTWILRWGRWWWHPCCTDTPRMWKGWMERTYDLPGFHPPLVSTNHCLHILPGLSFMRHNNRSVHGIYY